MSPSRPRKVQDPVKHQPPEERQRRSGQPQAVSPEESLLLPQWEASMSDRAAISDMPSRDVVSRDPQFTQYQPPKGAGYESEEEFEEELEGIIHGRKDDPKDAKRIAGLLKMRETLSTASLKEEEMLKLGEEVSQILLEETGSQVERRRSVSESTAEVATPVSTAVRPETPTYSSLPIEAENIAIFGQRQTAHEYQATRAKQKRQDRKKHTPYGRSLSYSQSSERSSERGGSEKPESGSYSPDAKKFSSLPCDLLSTSMEETPRATPKASSDETLSTKKEKEEPMETGDI